MSQQEVLAAFDDPLWRSLERILSFYQLRVDREMVESQLPIDWSKPLTPTELMLVAHQLGLEVSVRSIAGIDIKGLEKPTFIFLPTAKAIVILPENNALPELWCPTDDVDVEALLEKKERNLYAMSFEKRANFLKEATHLHNQEMNGAHWFWELFWQQSRDYIDIGLATFFLNVFALISPIFSMNVFDRVVPNHANETLMALTIGMIFAYLFNFGFKYIRGHILSKVVSRIATKLDVNFMDQLIRLSVPAHKLTVGEKFDLFNELQALRDFFASRLIPAVVDLPFFIIFLLIIYIISPGVMGVVLIGVVLLFVVNLSCRLSQGRASKNHFKEARSKNALLMELLSGAHSIRMFNAIGYTLFRWQRLSDRVATSSLRSQNMVALADDLSMSINYLISIFVIVVGVNEIETGDLTMGGMIACNILVGRTLQPVMSLANVIGRLRQSLDSLRTISNVFHMPAEPKLTLDYDLKGPFKGHMKLDDVTFYHQGQVHPTLYHLSLEIRPGEKVGLIGRTGVGKSTITRLLDGSIAPQTGHVFADHMVLSSIHPVEWRQSLGIVPQEPFLFLGTIRENILLGMKGEVDEAWLKEVIAMSGLDILLKQAGCGLDFNVGEGGIRLSGGQRQSLAIARALVRKPRILLLDEPTNGMDNELEQRVMASLQSYLRDKTMVLVTHRTPLLALVDRLILIDQGRITMDGPRDEVFMKLSGKSGA